VAIEVVHLSSVLKRPLVDQAGDKIGRVQDLIVRVGERPHPPIAGLVARIAGRDLFVPLRKIADIEPGRVHFVGERVTCVGSSAGPANCCSPRTCSAATSST